MHRRIVETFRLTDDVAATLQQRAALRTTKVDRRADLLSSPDFLKFDPQAETFLDTIRPMRFNARVRDGFVVPAAEDV